jgi:hypothetical protein
VNWEAIAAIGEMVGAIAAVVSVIYLAVQIRENTPSSMPNVVNITINDFSDLERLIASTPAFASSSRYLPTVTYGRHEVGESLDRVDRGAAARGLASVVSLPGDR